MKIFEIIIIILNSFKYTLLAVNKIPHKILSKLFVLILIIVIQIFVQIYRVKNNPKKTFLHTAIQDASLSINHQQIKILLKYAKKCGSNHIMQIMRCNDSNSSHCCYPEIVIRYIKEINAFINVSHSSLFNGKYNKFYCDMTMMSELLESQERCSIRKGNSLRNLYGEISDGIISDNINEMRTCFLTINYKGYIRSLFVHSILSEEENNICDVNQDLKVIELLKNINFKH